MEATSNFFFEGAFLNVFLYYSILLILFFYAIFSLVIVRQVDLMSKTLITPISPIVKAAAILHSGFAIGLLVLMFGVLR